MTQTPIPAGTKVTITSGVNAGRSGVIQAGKWPNQFGNYGVDIQQPNKETGGFWIGENDVKALEKSDAAKPAAAKPKESD